MASFVGAATVAEDPVVAAEAAILEDDAVDEAMSEDVDELEVDVEDDVLLVREELGADVDEDVLLDMDKLEVDVDDDELLDEEEEL